MQQAQALHADAPLIKLAGISKTYMEAGRSREVLHALDLEIRRGECVVLLGKSGSGKSTLLNLISAIDTPSSGEIIINSIPITQLSEQERTLFRRQYIGFVFQFFNLVPTLTVLENVLLPLELNGRTSRNDTQRALELLDAVGLADRRSSFPDRLSGGEQQRISIARALVHDPLLVLADEPTGNLDSETGDQILTLLNRLTRAAGKTLLMVTHSSDALAIADRVFRVREGHLEAIEPSQAQ
mgnify:CR=1 FL=1|jgi:ABC-type antimicrobial peptide transport system, ATPase component